MWGGVARDCVSAVRCVSGIDSLGAALVPSFGL